MIEGLFFAVYCLDTDPDDADNDVHPSLLSLAKLERPHSILSLVPIGTSGTVHSSAACVLFGHSLLVGGRGGCRRTGWCWSEVLDDGRVDSVFISRLAAVWRRGLGN